MYAQSLNFSESHQNNVLSRSTCIRIAKSGFQPICVLKRTFLYSWKKGINRDTVIWLQQPIDLSVENIRAWITRKEFNALRDTHRTQVSEINKLGPDLQAAHFVLKHKGSVKFHNLDRWFKADKDGKMDLPITFTKTYLKAIDASNTTMMYESFDNMENLPHLRYLNLSNCKYIDDWCLDRLVQFRETLFVLDLSGCVNVSERGLVTIIKLNCLKRLILKDMNHLQHAKLIALLLEEAMPNCYIDGIDYTNISKSEREDEPQSVSFMKSWEKRAMAEQMDVVAAVIRDYGVLENTNNNRAKNNKT
ncbi:hypothetical protein HELRODRAFT_176804 [Helobdella robusta]|uniref:ATP synthase subunit s-like protein n=1 Tax=Helobdella robusta TaxID=6412 RepID=T1FAX5_HELRO|nr:hypothetical protein HELRODRAFT_176804 [Helobdella robusta]ESN99634.1 hypothetical protein HELRODRAFT_176804 [Helobdella robusta]